MQTSIRSTTDSTQHGDLPRTENDGGNSWKRLRSSLGLARDDDDDDEGVRSEAPNAPKGEIEGVEKSKMGRGVPLPSRLRDLGSHKLISGVQNACG